MFVFFGLFSYGRCIASDYLFGIKLFLCLALLNLYAGFMCHVFLNFNLYDDITFLVLNNINPVRIPCILFSTIAMRFIVSYRHKVILTPQVLLCHINTIYLSSSPVFSGVRVTQSLVLCVCVADHCLSFCPFSFGHCVFCLLAIVLSVFRFTDSDYPFSIFKLFNSYNGFCLVLNIYRVFLFYPQSFCGNFFLFSLYEGLFCHVLCNLKQAALITFQLPDRK